MTIANDPRRSLSRRSTILRGFWLIWVSSNLLLWFLSLGNFYDTVTTQSYGSFIIGDTLWSVTAQQWAMQHLFLSPQGYALYKLVLSAVNLAVFYGVSGLIIWRGAQDWFSGFVAVFLLILGGQPNFTVLVASINSLVFPFFRLENVASWLLFFLFLNLFPDGRFVPRWMGFLYGLLSLSWFMLVFVFNQPMLGGLPLAIIAVGAIIEIFAQIYRYRNVSTPTQRQQTKWVLFFTSAFIVLAVLYNLLLDDTHPLYLDFVQIGILAVPISLGIAIMKYRLWDIDVIIRRTLVYGVLTTALALVFYLGVTLLQSLFQAVSGQQSAVSIIFSTLAIVALFNPLRKFVQDFIDRRFFRRKYDAEQALARFASTAKNETDIEQLSAELLAVVQQSMQPENLSLWLKPQEERRKQV